MNLIRPMSTKVGRRCEVGDLVWVYLRPKIFSVNIYNRLSSCKYDPYRVLEHLRIVYLIDIRPDWNISPVLRWIDLFSHQDVVDPDLQPTRNNRLQCATSQPSGPQPVSHAGSAPVMDSAKDLLQHGKSTLHMYSVVRRQVVPSLCFPSYFYCLSSSGAENFNPGVDAAVFLDLDLDIFLTFIRSVYFLVRLCCIIESEIQFGSPSPPIKRDIWFSLGLIEV